MNTAKCVIDFEDKEVLRAGAIFGANGTGKTTVLSAIDTLRQMIVSPGQNEESTYDPYVLDVNEKPTIFSLWFEKNSIRYFYEIKYSDSAIFEEKLYYVSKATDIQSASLRFSEAMKNISNQGEILNALKENKMEGETDILRAQVMYLESALDYYIHEVVKYGIEKMFSGYSNWRETVEFKKLRVSISFTKEIHRNPEKVKEIYNELDYVLPTYMKYDAIMKSMILIGVFDENNIPPEISSYRKKLNEVSDRRNKIVHAFDRTDFGKQKYLDENMVKEYIHTVCNFQKIIEKSVLYKNDTGKFVYCMD